MRLGPANFGLFIFKDINKKWSDFSKPAPDCLDTGLAPDSLAFSDSVFYIHFYSDTNGISRNFFLSNKSETIKLGKLKCGIRIEAWASIQVANNLHSLS